MSSSPLAQRLHALRQQIADSCQAAGRPTDSVELLAVSKTFPHELVAEAYQLGLQRFGENRAQDLRARAEYFPTNGPRWVMIGHAQTNKARDIVRYAHELQSLDRLPLAEALERRLQRAGHGLDVLIQLKTAREDSKFGLDPEALPEFMRQLQDFPALRVRGLMTMATQTDDEAEIRRCFRLARTWRDRLQNEGYAEVQRLSMGMSHDFALAIAEGATEVRVGSALFGARDAA